MSRKKVARYYFRKKGRRISPYFRTVSEMSEWAQTNIPISHGDTIEIVKLAGGSRRAAKLSFFLALGSSQQLGNSKL